MALNFEITGSGPRLVLLHGFTQNINCWGRLKESLESSFELVLIDLPGHGLSTSDEVSLYETAKLIVDIGGYSHYFGYSMGARILLYAALNHPDLVRTATLLGVNPGLEFDSELIKRKQKENAWIQDLEVKGVDQFVDGWISQDFFSLLSKEDANLQARKMNRKSGLVSSLEFRGLSSQDNLWPYLADIETPIMLVAGNSDSKFQKINKRIFDNSPSNFQTLVIPGDHAAHLELEGSDLADFIFRLKGFMD